MSNTTEYTTEALTKLRRAEHLLKHLQEKCLRRHDSSPLDDALATSALHLTQEAQGALNASLRVEGDSEDNTPYRTHDLSLPITARFVDKEHQQTWTKELLRHPKPGETEQLEDSIGRTFEHTILSVARDDDGDHKRLLCYVVIKGAPQLQQLRRELNGLFDTEQRTG